MSSCVCEVISGQWLRLLLPLLREVWAAARWLGPGSVLQSSSLPGKSCTHILKEQVKWWKVKENTQREASVFSYLSPPNKDVEIIWCNSLYARFIWGYLHFRKHWVKGVSHRLVLLMQSFLLWHVRLVHWDLHPDHRAKHVFFPIHWLKTSDNYYTGFKTFPDSPDRLLSITTMVINK